MSSLGDGIFMGHVNYCYTESPHISLQTACLDASAHPRVQERARAARCSSWPFRCFSGSWPLGRWLDLMPEGNGNRINVTIHNTSVDKLFPTFQFGSTGRTGSWQHCDGAEPAIIPHGCTDWIDPVNRIHTDIKINDIYGPILGVRTPDVTCEGRSNMKNMRLISAFIFQVSSLWMQ